MNKIFTAFLLAIGFQTFAQNPVLIPPTLSGNDISLNLQYGTYQFYPGANTSTIGANGNILGPTLILTKGDSINFSVTNQLNDTTTIHWHGLHVSPENDGGPHTTIAPGAIWKPAFRILDRAATYWYHPHLHKKTNEHVSKGLAGFIIIKDNVEKNLVLPRTYGVDDFPLAIQTKDFDGNNEIVVPSNADDIVMVNATIDGVLEVPAQVVRLRLLNGSSMRVFNLGLSGNETFYQIASDGGLLSNSISLTRLQLAPGERAEILVDFTGKTGQPLSLKSYASEFPNGIYGATNPGTSTNMVLNGYQPNPLNGSDFDVMQFTVVAQTSSPITTIPSSLVTVTPIPEADANLSRDLLMSPATMGLDQLNGDFLINRVSFDLNIVNYEVPIDNVEIWGITNRSAIAHPFHIHDVQFYVLDKNGVAPPANERGRKDVILIKPQETVRFITKFEDFKNTTVPYMYHCHMLYHEDRGMMGQFLVVDRVTGLNNLNKPHDSWFYPNPANNIVQLNINENLTLQSVLVTDLLGKIIIENKEIKTGEPLDISSLPAGVYMLKIIHNRGEFSDRLLVK